MQSLRVADASVMPTITGAGPYEPTMMIAEKLAEQLLQLYEDGKVLLLIAVARIILCFREVHGV